MQSYAITFGQKYRHEQHPADPRIHPDSYVVVDATSSIHARDLAFEHLGSRWAFIYPMDEFAAEHHPRGCLGILGDDGRITDR